MNLGSSNVIVTAPSADTLDLEGPSSSNVDLIGVSTFTFAGKLRTPTSDLGGHCYAFRGERSASAASGTTYSVSWGENDTGLGSVMPQAGTAIWLTWDCNTASTCTIALVGSSSGTLLSISVSGGTTGSASGSAAFGTKEMLNVQVTSGTASGASRVYWIVRLN